ncbi:MAG: MlaC/ttg2D family ABC transporter substrate-binding protein [Thermodesulfobacteriota bacterium]
MRKYITLLLTFIVFSAVPAAAHAAADADEAEKVGHMLKGKLDTVLELLEDQNLPEAKMKKRIMGVVEPVIDFEIMAKLTLGRSNWGRLSESEREKFIKLFVEQLKTSYLDKTTLYSGQKVILGKSRQQGGKIQVPMELETSDDTVTVLYKFYPKGEEWKVYDVVINDVSLIRSYRSQFNEILKNGTVEEFLKALEKDNVEPLS